MQGNIWERPIGENEEELLEKIWNSLPPVENDDQMLDENYRNVKQRIHKHTLRRHVIYISSSAAAVCLFILLLFSPESSEKSPVFAQLNDMGVSISEQKVQFMIGDSIVANLNTSAKMNITPNAKTTLQSATGEEIALTRGDSTQDIRPRWKAFRSRADGRHSRVVKFGHMARIPGNIRLDQRETGKNRGRRILRSQTGCHETLSRRNSRRRIPFGYWEPVSTFQLTRITKRISRHWLPGKSNTHSPHELKLSPSYPMNKYG